MAGAQADGKARPRDARAWPLRPVSPELVRRYRREGHWTDETLGGFLHDQIVARPDLQLRVWSQTRPFQDEVGRIYRRALGLAAALRARGVGPGDVVAFQLPNWAEAAEVFWGVSALGAVLAPIVHFYGTKEVGYILRESGARVFVTADRFGRNDYLAGLEALRPELPDLESVWVVESEPGVALPAGAERFRDASDVDPLDGPQPVDPSSPAVVAYTSGTTADPKGVIHTHQSLIFEVRQLSAQVPERDRPGLMGAPVAHFIGMLGGLLIPPYKSRPIHLLDVWDPARVIEIMVEADLSAGGGSTYFLTSLLDQPGFGAEQLKRLTFAGLGGSPVPAAVAERAEALGIAVARAYGSTEHPSTTGSKPDEPREKRNHTDGHALLGVELRLQDPDGRDVTASGHGEIASRGPDMCAGYTDPALNEAFDPEGWYRSGDVGVLDADGYLTITDRVKDIIIRGGENVSAAEVEELLQRLPGVAEVAVVAAPDPRLGEHGCAFLRLAPGAHEPDLPELRGHLEACGLARQKWPEELRMIDEFPRTPSGKIVKAELRRRLRAEA